MTLVVLAGLGAGVGIVGMLAGLRRPRPALQRVFEALEREVFPEGSAVALAGTTSTRSARAGDATQGNQIRRTSPWRVDSFLGARLEMLLDSGWSPVRALKGRLDSALNVTGARLDTLCAQAVVGGIVGLLLPAVCWGIVSFGGVRVPLAAPVWAAVLLAGAGVLLPVAVLSTEVRRRRREARRTVGTFLDLVVLCLAGGMGIEGALHSAARVGNDDVSARLLAALNLARDSGEPPWEALAGLGAELGVDELAELAAAVGLAGTQGARIRSTLAAKAASIRRHELADAEAHANSVTERLFLPGVLLLVGFLVFIGYPAVSRIASGF